MPLAIPAHARGTLSVVVADAARTAEWDQREGRGPDPQSLGQLLRDLNRARRNDHLYVRLVGQEPGAVVAGEALPALPPSVLSVLEADRSGGSYRPLRSTVLAEQDLPLGHALIGSRLLTFSVEPDRPR